MNLTPIARAAHYTDILNQRPAAVEGEPYTFYGTRILTFLLAYDEHLLGLFDLDALECARYTAHQALARTVNLGTKDNKELTPTCVFDRLEDIRRQLTASIEAQRAHVAATLAPYADPKPAPRGLSGTGVLASEIAPKPLLPPSGAAVDPYETRKPAYALTATDVDDPF